MPMLRLIWKADSSRLCQNMSSISTSLNESTLTAIDPI